MTPEPNPNTLIPELLAPAGTMEAFKAALAAGADAIYCGLGQLNARRNAENLTLDDFAEACCLAHLAGSRVYVTANVLVREDELAGALKLVHDCAAAGADGFIFQDWGLVRLVRELWPELELHLSTQANVHDPRGVRFAADRGLARVTLSRELSLEEIERCSHEGVELEIFGHGALCVCYSGECLLSSMQRGRSANRGLCRQPCRLPYRRSANRGLCRQPCRLPYRMLDEDGREVAHVNGSRLLSPRDNCTIDDIAALAKAGCGALKIEGRMKAPDYVGTVVGAYRALAKAGCGALKIEGRMKAPDYVGTVVGAYRRAIDDLGRGQDPSADAPVMRALARAFNRDFTDAYLHGRSDNAMMSFERGNNRGQLAGSVVRVEARRTVLHLTEPVGEGDLLEIRNPERFDDYVTVPSPQASGADTDLAVRLPRPMGVGCPVRVIRSEEGMARAREYAARRWPRKRAVHVHVVARIGKPFTVELSTIEGDAHPSLQTAPVVGCAEGFIVEAARTRSVTAEDLIEHVGRLGTSPFEAVSWDVELDEGAGMAFSAVHTVRSDAANSLEHALLAPWEDRAQSLTVAPYSVAPRQQRRPADRRREPVVCALATSPEIARAALHAGASVVYAPAEDLVLGAGSSGRPHDGENGTWPEGVIPSPEIARAALHAGASVVYAPAEDLVLGAGSSGRPHDGENGTWPEGVIPILGEISRTREQGLFGDVIKPGAPVACGTVGWLAVAVERGALPWLWHTLPFHNHAAARELHEAGAVGAWLSPELELLEIEALARSCELELGMVVSGYLRTMTTEHCLLQSMGPCGEHCENCQRRRGRYTLRSCELELGMVVSGYLRTMTTEHCLLQSMGPCGEHCENCQRRRGRYTLRDEFDRLGMVVSGYLRTMTTEHCLLQSMGPCGEHCENCQRRRGRYTLRDEFDRPSLVTSDVLGRSRLWWPSPLDLTPQIPELFRAGITRFMVDAQLLNADQAAKAVRRAVRALEDARNGRVPAPRESGATSGHLFERIG